MCNQPVPVTPQLLLNAVQGELNALAYYQKLGQMASDSHDSKLIQTMQSEKTEHVNALMRLYRQLTGADMPSLTPQPAQILSYMDAVKASIPRELRESERYRCIYLTPDNPACSLFYDIMECRKNHAAVLNYLYIRSVERCCCQTPEPVVCDGITYTVQEGDSLWQIAQRYAVPMESLLAANPQITDPGVVYGGQVLCIPCTGITYTVLPGDSLWQIAQRHGISVEELTATNPLIADPASIYPGQVLCIPCCTGEPVPAEKESLTYLYGGTADYYLRQLANTGGALRTVCPDFFSIDDNGGLLLASADRLNPAFITELHRQGLRVTPFISNHWNRQIGVAAMSNRENLTSQLAAAILQYNLDGVNFDIENLTEAHRAAYVDLARLMREKLPADKTVSVAVAANPNGWDRGWHGSYDYPGLAEHCDYLVIMAYDESYQGGPEGPVSGASFFENSIRYALDQGVPKEKIVVGIPFFGRYWKDGEAVGGIGISDRDIENLLASYDAVAEYDEAVKSACAVVTIRPEDTPPQIWGGRVLTAGTYRIWYDNLPATRYKLETIARYGVKGAGSWALGQENTAVWDFYTDALQG